VGEKDPKVQPVPEVVQSYAKSVLPDRELGMP